MSAAKEVLRTDQRLLQQPVRSGQVDGHGRGRGGQRHRNSQRRYGKAPRKDSAGVDDRPQLPQPQGPRRDHDHLRGSAHRTARNRSRNVLRVGPRCLPATERNCWAGWQSWASCPIICSSKATPTPSLSSGTIPTPTGSSPPSAPTARRLMESRGLSPPQVAQVRGYAERQLRHPENPDAASNRRISVIVQYLTPPPGSENPDGKSSESPASAAPKGGEPKAEKEQRYYMYSGISMPSTPAVRSNCRRKKSVIHNRNTFFSRFSSWMMGYRS